MNFNDFFLSENDKLIITNWIDSFNNNTVKKPLLIHGNIGCGKTTLTNIILKNYTHININNYLLNVNINEYINDCLCKKDISMMFNNKKYKAIIFDNITPNNKIIIKEIKILLNNLNNYIKNPIIIIINNNYDINKTINFIKSKSINIYIKYTETNLYHIIYNIFDSKLNSNNINNIISKYNDNLDYIVNNRNFILQNFYSYIDDNNKNIIDMTKYLINEDIITIFIKYSSDYNLIGLNILDNLDIKFNNIKYILEIYKSLCIYDNYHNFKITNNLYNNTNISIIYSILIPFYYIKNFNILLANIKYNKYISKSVIYTHNILINNDIYKSYIYYDILLRLLYNFNDININKFKIIFKRYNCNIKTFNFYIKLANIIYNKKLNNVNYIKYIKT